MSIPSEPAFNPLDKKNLGISVADALLTKPLVGLAALQPFWGAGIYALYYGGDYAPYEPIRVQALNNPETVPIYVGKAVPPGARKGAVGVDAPPGKVLFNRLNQHAESVKQTQNLAITDFFCRYLIVEDIWIPLGESLLIQKFTPIWNRVIDGFGNHTPGKGRFGQSPSDWDILHPGRDWVIKLTGTPRAEAQILDALKRFFSGDPTVVIKPSDEE